MIKIVTDTTADLPPTMVNQCGIAVVPINIQFVTESYEEGVNIDQNLLYRKIEELGLIPTTSQPSVGQFVEVYHRLARESVNKTLSLHVTSKLTGTYQSARLASQEVADEVKLYPYDSLAGSGALGPMCLEASQIAREGTKPEEIITRLDEIRPRVNVVFTVETPEYARKSGRMGGLKAALASLLNVKPIVALQDAELAVLENVRSRKRSLERLLDVVENRVGTTAPLNLAVVHARAVEVAREVLAQSGQRFNCTMTYLHDICAALTVHFGPGTIGVCFYAL